jgi:hypothetical protein
LLDDTHKIWKQKKRKEENKKEDKSWKYLGHKYRISSVVLRPAHNQRLEKYQYGYKANAHSLEGTPTAKCNHPHHDADKWQGQHQSSQEH